MPRHKFTDRFIKSVTSKPPKQRTDYFDTVLPSFGIRVSTESASWFVFYRLDGEQIRDSFAKHARLTLAEARQEARRRLDILDQGRDPRAEDDRLRALAAKHRTETVGKVFDAYKLSHLDKLRSGAELWAAVKADLLPTWSDLPIRALTRAMIKTKLDETEVERGPYARNRRLALIRHFLNYALDLELVDANAAARIAMLPEVERDRVLSDSELVEVWHAAGGLVPPEDALIKLLILTGLRLTEVSLMQWTEVDEAEGVWLAPASRMKAKIAHEVPLTSMIMDVIRGVPTWSARKTFVLASAFRKDSSISGFSQLKREIDDQILQARKKTNPGATAMARWRFHDLRRTTRSGLSKIRIPSEIAERVIGHLPAGVRRVYDRYQYRQEKRDALAAWGAYVLALVEPKQNVTSLEHARQQRQ